MVILYFWLLVEFYRKSALSKLFLKLKTLPYIQRASPVSQLVENPAEFLFSSWIGKMLEKQMATHSSTLGLENPRDRGAWWATVHGVAKSWTQLSTHTSICTNGQGLEQWDPILQLCEVVEFNKSSWKEKKKLGFHMINSCSRAWMVRLESHCHSSSVVLISFILEQFINSWGGKKVYKKLKSFTSHSYWRTGCMVLRRNLLIVLLFFFILLCIGDNIIIKLILKCKASWHHYICSTRDMFSKYPFKRTAILIIC